MEKIRIGVLCPSEIAFRRFMPALSKVDDFSYVGVASADETEWHGHPSEELLSKDRAKAQNFQETYGGNLFTSYHQMLESTLVDAIYIPLPPALHHQWAKLALEKGKHVLLEKPFTTTLKDTRELLSLAAEKNLAVHENYMFAYHSQLEDIQALLAEGAVGEIRLIRIDFGFPFRGAADFRYDKALGGGALLDCGGYTLKLASLLLGETAKVTVSQLNLKKAFEVDVFGSATLTNEKGLTAQVSFGMDNSYRCSLDIWGSTGSLYTNRILTAPDGFSPSLTLRQGDQEKKIVLSADDTFQKSIAHFGLCVRDADARERKYREIEKQSMLLEQIRE